MMDAVKSHPCPDCAGTGRDEARTKAARRAGRCDGGSYVRCWACLGNGVDPDYVHRLSRAVESVP